MDESQIVDIWNLFKNYIDKKQGVMVSENFVDLLVDYGVDDQTLESCIGNDALLDHAIMYYLDMETDLDDDDFDEEY